MRVALISVLALGLTLAGCGPANEPAAPSEPGQAVVSEAPLMPVDAPPQEEPIVETPTDEAGPATDCLADIGAEASARLVERCIRVSPATRPPCNAANPCEMIQGEIDRSCAMYGEGEARPPECAA